MVEIVLSSDANRYHWNTNEQGKALTEACSIFKIDLKQLRKEARAELRKKPKKDEKK